VVKLTIEVLLLIHLISAYPMGINPANQFMEQLIGIQPGSVIKRAVFRTLMLVLQLFVAETLPTFSGLMQLVASVFVTCLTFIFPPLFYMQLTRKAKVYEKSKDRKLSWLEVFLCSQVIIIGAFGGVVSFLSAITYIREMEFIPCYVTEMERTC